MQISDHDIEKNAARWLSKLETEEPSASFTADVMKSVYALELKTHPSRGYWLFLLILPVGIAGWYLSTLPYFFRLQTDFLTWYHNMNLFFGDYFTNLRQIRISPIIILSFLAILSLLLLDDIFIRSRNKNMKAETKS